jgi:hypothetical protein
VGPWDLTLREVAAHDLTGLARSEVQWRSGRVGVCPGCVTAPAEIDARWPAERRDDGCFVVACPCPACQQFGPGTEAPW